MLRHTISFLARRKRLETYLRHNRLARQTANRFIAGETRAEALAMACRLYDEGFLVGLDSLGEEAASLLQANAAAEEYIGLIEEAEAKGLGAEISIKLSQLGIRLDEGLAFRHLQRIVKLAAAVHGFIRVDMEESDLTEKVMAMVRQVHSANGHVGAVVQSYLRRSSLDVDLLNKERISIRLVKGTYREPRETAFQDAEEIDLYYMRHLEALFREGTRPVIATHDAKLIEYAIDMAFIFGRGLAEYEFQMLNGVRCALQQKLQQEGYQVRIYLPYGKNWYSYFLRRLAQRPMNLRYFLKTLRH